MQQKINIILQECIEIDQSIKMQQKNLQNKIDEVKKILPKGYWWSYDVDKSWKHPKKYRIKEVSLVNKNFFITVKEVFKKAPWKGFTGERGYYLSEFLELSIYKTEEQAKNAYYNRICPKCGGIMKYGKYKWCDACINERHERRVEFANNHRFYYPESDSIYTVGYVDELTRNCDKGHNGKHFTIQRLDTMEIIHTDNLWVGGSYEFKDTLPKIIFLPEDK